MGGLFKVLGGEGREGGGVETVNYLKEDEKRDIFCNYKAMSLDKYSPIPHLLASKNI